MATFEEKKQALANYLECDVEEITDGYDSDHFEYGNEEYAVYTDEEADQAHKDYIENFIDDVGIAGFTPSFQDWIINYAINNSDWFEQAQRESAEGYVNDIESENDNTYENRLIAELVENDFLDEDDDFHFDEDDEDQEYPLLNDDVDLESAKDEYIEKLCEEDPYEWYKWNFGEESIRDLVKNGDISLDIDAISDEIISWDGRGNNLAFYDSEELDLGDGLYAYRQN